MAGNQRQRDRHRTPSPSGLRRATAPSAGHSEAARCSAEINGNVANATTINSGTFIGRRYVNNVVKAGSPSYAAAIDFVGVDSGGNGFLCTDDAAKNAIITQYGFVLNSFAPAGPGLPNSRCRKNPAPL